MKYSIPHRTGTRHRQTPGGDDGSSQEMKMTPYLREALIDDIYLTIKGQELLEEVEQVDHLIEILMTMGHLVMEDILQDMDHQEVDHQEEEEDHLVPLAHLEILDPLEKEDHQA